MFMSAIPMRYCKRTKTNLEQDALTVVIGMEDPLTWTSAVQCPPGSRAMLWKFSEGDCMKSWCLHIMKKSSSKQDLHRLWIPKVTPIELNKHRRSRDSGVESYMSMKEPHSFADREDCLIFQGSSRGGSLPVAACCGTYAARSKSSSAKVATEEWSYLHCDRKCCCRRGTTSLKI